MRLIGSAEDVVGALSPALLLALAEGEANAVPLVVLRT